MKDRQITFHLFQRIEGGQAVTPYAFHNGTLNPVIVEKKSVQTALGFQRGNTLTIKTAGSDPRQTIVLLSTPHCGIVAARQLKLQNWNNFLSAPSCNNHNPGRSDISRQIRLKPRPGTGCPAPPSMPCPHLHHRGHRSVLFPWPQDRLPAAFFIFPAILIFLHIQAP